MESLANAFVDHLIDSRYVGGSNVSVGLTKRNMMNIYNLVSKECFLCQLHSHYDTHSAIIVPTLYLVSITANL